MTKRKKVGRGGKRPGAGRPCLNPSGRMVHEIRVPPIPAEVKQAARAAGLSIGGYLVEQAARAARLTIEAKNNSAA